MPYYTKTFDVTPGSRVGSQRVEDEFANVQTGFTAVAAEVTRSIKIPASPVPSDQLINLSAAARAGLVVGFDVSGNITARTPPDALWLGAQAADPTTNLVGGALVAGNIYYNSVAAEVRVYNSSAWVQGYVTSAGFVTLTGTQTLTNKTITAPLGIVKSDVGLGSVDNTADTAKSVASAATLTTARTIDGQSFNGSANITVIAPGTVAAVAKTTPVDADVLPLADSAAANVLAKVTWANIKATLKTYFDSLATTLTNKTLTAPVLSGTVTGTYTLGGTATISTETVIAPTFTNAWANYGGAYITARYSKDPAGVVTVAGAIAGGTMGASAFTLPAGYRPPATITCASNSSGTAGFIEVASTGTVMPTVGTNTFFAFNFSFRI